LAIQPFDRNHNHSGGNHDDDRCLSAHPAQAVFDKMLSMSERSAYMQKRVRDIPVMHDLAVRFRIMEQYHDYAQVLTLNLPPIEIVAGPKESPGLAKLTNDSMANLVAKYPKHFPALFGALPATECGLAFFGSDHVLFGTDMPFDPEKGRPPAQEDARRAS
jgi:predicted TIM-barrel fold metal-dependent hydrolase